jgi:hypothetical protein
MPRGAELWQALYGAWRLARLDRQAMNYFDLSHHGVWRSFWAAVYCYPGFLLLLWLRLDAPTLAQTSLGWIFLIETIGYVVAWCAFPLVAIGLCRWFGREDQGFEFVTAYNWSQVLQTAFFVLLALISLPLPDGVAVALGRLGLIAMLGYEWFIAFVAIGAGGWMATALVVIDVVIGSFIVVITASLY